MGLINTTLLGEMTDLIGQHYKKLYDAYGTETSPPADSLRANADRMLAISVNNDNYELQASMNAALKSLTGVATQASKADDLNGAISALSKHCQSYGSTVNSSITNLRTYLAYLNTVPWTFFVMQGFGDCYADVIGSALTADHVASDSMNPLVNSGTPNGMGRNTVGGAFAAGEAIDHTLYAEAAAIAVVATAFSGGGSAPAVTVAGTDDTGATTTTWGGTFTGNNPGDTTAVNTTLSAPVATAYQRATVAVGSITGMVAWQVLSIDTGASQEYVIVEEASGGNLTAYFKKTHAGGAAVTGAAAVALTPSVAGRRLRSVSGITLTIGTHSAGSVIIDCVQPRGY
jgi:hypothetical protein